jgi:hypothetical protein
MAGCIVCYSQERVADGRSPLPCAHTVDISGCDLKDVIRLKLLTFVTALIICSTAPARASKEHMVGSNQLTMLS